MLYTVFISRKLLRGSVVVSDYDANVYSFLTYRNLFWGTFVDIQTTFVLRKKNT